MGRSDKKTRKGKIFACSFGNARPHKVQATVAARKSTEAEAKPKKARAAKVKE